ncbi:MAG: Rrf2 family transcriptional regulator [Acidobacteria bacterium]|nr:Rrf2 family transcriptional regulator [Acidobacteriota bacterium]MBI3663029.1 Rrf2 family transcriptional regulator [Acidobacteriota bacterium]
MLFSRTAEYAIRAMTFLATQPPGKLTGAKAISSAEKIPMPFLWKILQTLAHRRLIRSFKGLHGGYELASPAGQIPLLAIVQAMNMVDPVNRCAMGLARCGEGPTCPLHDAWKDLRERAVAMLEQNTLADLARAAKRYRRPPRRRSGKRASSRR